MSIAYAIAELFAASGLVAAAALIASAWRDLPAEIPIHYGFSGEADGWGPRGFIVGLPIAAFLLAAGLAFLSRPPGMGYLDKWMLALFQIEIVWMFTYLTWRSIQVALRKAAGLGRWFLPASVIPAAIILVAYIALGAR